MIFMFSISSGTKALAMRRLGQLNMLCVHIIVGVEGGQQMNTISVTLEELAAVFEVIGKSGMRANCNSGSEI